MWLPSNSSRSRLEFDIFFRDTFTLLSNDPQETHNMAFQASICLANDAHELWTTPVGFDITSTLSSDDLPIPKQCLGPTVLPRNAIFSEQHLPRDPEILIRFPLFASISYDIRSNP